MLVEIDELSHVSMVVSKSKEFPGLGLQGEDRPRPLWDLALPSPVVIGEHTRLENGDTPS